MLDRGLDRLTPVNIGDSVRIPVPLVDRSRSTARNLLGVILEEPRPGFIFSNESAISKNIRNIVY